MLDRLTPISALLAYMALSVAFITLLLLSRQITRGMSIVRLSRNSTMGVGLHCFLVYGPVRAWRGIYSIGSVILGVFNSDPSEVAAFQLSLSFAALIGLPLVVINLVIGPQIGGGRRVTKPLASIWRQK